MVKEIELNNEDLQVRLRAAKAAARAANEGVDAVRDEVFYRRHRALGWLPKDKQAKLLDLLRKRSRDIANSQHLESLHERKRAALREKVEEVRTVASYLPGTYSLIGITHFQGASDERPEGNGQQAHQVIEFTVIHDGEAIQARRRVEELTVSREPGTATPQVEVFPDTSLPPVLRVPIHEDIIYIAKRAAYDESLPGENTAIRLPGFVNNITVYTSSIASPAQHS